MADSRQNPSYVAKPLNEIFSALDPGWSS